MNLTGTCAVVTGGNSGIGKAVAFALAREGAGVVIAGRRAKLNEAVAAEIRERFGRRALAVTADVSREADCERLIAETAREFSRLDILVNNASESAPRWWPRRWPGRAGRN